MPKIRVVMADDFVPLRQAMRRNIDRDPDIIVVGEAGNGAEALQQVEENDPDVLLLDIEMPVMDGIDVARRLHRQGSDVKIIILSIYNDRKYIQSVLELGVAGYLTKDEPAAKIIDVIHRVAAGETGWYSDRVQGVRNNTSEKTR